MIKILNAEAKDYSPQARKILESLGELKEANFRRDGLISAIGTYDVVIVRLRNRIDREVIDAAHRLKVIVSATTGLDHIDIDYAAERGITTLSLRGEVDFLRSIPATAEHTWALLLSLTRRIPRAVDATRANEWNRDELRGHDLAGRRLGIVGLGRIGEKVARYGLAFNMQVAAFDPYRRDWMPEVLQCPTLNKLLSESDVLALHVPLNDETRHMIGAGELAKLPKGAMVVNTARGAVLDSAALAASLQQGHLGGAALDVIEDEMEVQKRQNSPLLDYARQHDNLLITPHIGGATYESMAQTEVFMARKLQTWLKQKNRPD
jgi:D-3-phosphoglycerate dehydrogenase / 2-oxoglutarate reductase